MAIAAIHTWQPPQAAGRDRKGDRTRAQLFEASLAEFRRVGFDAASVGQIAARAGTSRASFYFHYPCKEAVLLDLQWRMELEMVERIRPCGGLREALSALMEALIEVETHLEQADLLKDMLSVYIRRPAGLDLMAQPFPLRVEVTRRFAAAAARALRAGLDPALASDLFLSSLFGLLLSLRGSLASRRAEALQLAALFLESPKRATRRA
ncbi:MAG: helix-turn-helix domain-containing protein [bacterium]